MTSPLIVRNLIDWPVGSRPRPIDLPGPGASVLRKGERGVVRGNPLALWRGAGPGYSETAIASGVDAYKVGRSKLDHFQDFVDALSFANGLTRSQIECQIDPGCRKCGTMFAEENGVVIRKLGGISGITSHRLPECPGQRLRQPDAF